MACLQNILEHTHIDLKPLASSTALELPFFNRMFVKRVLIRICTYFVNISVQSTYYRDSHEVNLHYKGNSLDPYYIFSRDNMSQQISYQCPFSVKPILKRALIRHLQDHFRRQTPKFHIMRILQDK